MPASGFYGCTHPKKHLQLYHWLKSLFPQYLLEQIRRSGGLPSPRANVPCEWGPCKMEIQEAGSSQGGRTPCWSPAQAKKKLDRHKARAWGCRGIFLTATPATYSKLRSLSARLCSQIAILAFPSLSQLKLLWILSLLWFTPSHQT